MIDRQLSEHVSGYLQQHPNIGFKPIFVATCVLYVVASVLTSVLFQRLDDRQRRAALLRNHGVVIAGEDVRWAVLTALVLERAIRFQAIAATPATWGVAMEVPLIPPMLPLLSHSSRRVLYISGVTMFQ